MSDRCPQCGSDVKRWFERRGKHHGIQHTECTNKGCFWGMAEADADEAAIKERVDMMHGGRD